jgi:hypothetical protein
MIVVMQPAAAVLRRVVAAAAFGSQRHQRGGFLVALPSKADHTGDTHNEAFASKILRRHRHQITVIRVTLPQAAKKRSERNGNRRAFAPDDRGERRFSRTLDQSVYM